MPFEDRVLNIRPGHRRIVTLRPAEGAEGWKLRVRHTSGTEELAGPEALRVSGRLLARLNRDGGNEKMIAAAVGELKGAGSADRLYAVAARSLWIRASYGRFSINLAEAKPHVRLALEMAAHEEEERRALESELKRLEEAWRQAEEIAAIADRFGGTAVRG